MLDIVLFSIPEALVVAWLANTLSGTRLPRLKLMFVGAITGVISNFTRKTTSFFALHMIVYACAMAVLFGIVETANAWKRGVSVIIALPLYLLVEYYNILIVRHFVSLERLGESLVLKLLCFAPQIFATLLLILFLKRTGFSLFLNPQNEEV
ncbi:MAG TPA: hypothetical protein PKL39_08770 [Bacillota bacterium]|nr:hypothetical protein [Bacillota bacterium]HPZ91348.1 hypothetical protein [Bacillota bacterium]HQE02684.1 hypothetical protein [Bacillota bacterium]